MIRKCDVLIIGAGILGCFAARALSRYNLDIAVIEKREDVCTGITRANTGIIYQGYDQHPGSLKARLTRQASLSFPSLCEELDVRYRKTGLLMLSFGPNADRVLKKKIENGKQNGIEDIKILDSRSVYELEPALCGGISSALYSENTYTVDPWELGIAAFENALSNGVQFYFNEEALNISRSDGGFVVESAGTAYLAGRVLCCAGFSADSLWEMVSRPAVRLVPLAADYLVFDRSVGDTISHVISVEPENKGEGLTLVPTYGGNILAGPTRRRISGVPDGSTDIGGIQELKEKCRSLIPSLPADKIIRNFGATRPNPYCTNEDGSISEKSLNDFVILEEDGFFDLIGIKTPGITCANELGNHIASLIINSLEKKPGMNPVYSPVRKGIPKISALIEEDSPLLASLSEDCFEIICRCEHISRGEVLEAIRRGATTLDGVKRRTGTGMGRCQGGYCSEKILKILSNCLGKNIYEINKDGPGSEMILR